MSRRLLIVVVGICAHAQLLAQSRDSLEFDAKAQRGIEYVYNLEFEKAGKEFGDLVRMRPQHPVGHFFLAMVQWWRILIDIDNEERDDALYDALDSVVDMCDEMLDKNPNDVTALFFKGGSIGFKGRLKAHRSEWIGAANAGRKALPIVQRASVLDSTNYDVLLGSGIYNYYAEIIPEEYPFVKPLMLFVPPGDKQRGIQQLAVAAEKGKYAGIESMYFLMQLCFVYEKDYPKALSLARVLHSRFPNNMLFHKYLGRCYVALNNWQEADSVFSEILSRSQKSQRGYTASIEREAEYYLGLNDMNTRRYETALQHLYRCDELSRALDKEEPSGFMVMTNLKVGMIYDALAKRDLAVSQYRKVLGMKQFKDSYKQAEQYLRTPFPQ